MDLSGVSCNLFWSSDVFDVLRWALFRFNPNLWIPVGHLPGSRSGHSASSLPTGSTGKASATTYPARGDTDFLELVIDAALPLPLYWATRDGVHIFPDPNRIAEIQRLMTDTWPVLFFSIIFVVTDCDHDPS